MSRTVRVAELLDSSQVRVGSDSVLEFYTAKDLDTVPVSEHLDIFTAADSVHLPPSRFIISPVCEAQVVLGAGVVAGVTVPESGRIVIPAYQYQDQIPVHSSVFIAAELTSGIVTLQIDNQTRVVLDTIEVELPDGDVFQVGPLDSMSHRDLRLELSRMTIESLFSVRYRLVTSGTGSDSVWCSAHDSLRLLVRLDSARMKQGTVRLGGTAEISASQSSTDYLRLTRCRTTIDSMSMRSGWMTFTVDNRLGMPLSVQVRAPETGFDTFFPLQGHERLSFNRNLTGTTYRNDHPDSSRLTVIWLVRADQNGQVVRVESTDALRAWVSTEVPEFKYLQGVLYDTLWSKNTYSDSSLTDLTGEIHRVRFSHAWLDCDIENTVGFRGRLHARVSARSATGESAVTSSAGDIPAGKPGSPARTSIRLDIAPLLNISPKQLTFSWQVGLYGRGEAWYESYGTGRVQVSTPLRVTFSPDTIDAGTWSIPISPKVRPNASREVKDCQFTARVINHLPVSLAGKILLSARNRASAEIPFALPAPRLDEGQGWVAQPLDSTFTLGLDSAQSRVFYADSFRAHLELYLPSTDTVTITARDYFQLENSNVRLNLSLKPH